MEIATGQRDEEYDEESGKEGGLTCLGLAFSRWRTVCRQISRLPSRVRPKMWVKLRKATVSGLP